VLHQLDTVQIEAFPRNLPDELVVDATKLVEIHDKLTVEDIQVPEGVTILTDLEYPIATVIETKAMMSEEATEEGGEDIEGQAAEGAEAEATGQEAS
jgi:large subunit ribosomal protein L25